jgi:hypothetical protein
METKPLGKPLPEAIETLREWIRLRDLGRKRKAEYDEAQRKLSEMQRIESPTDIAA